MGHGYTGDGDDVIKVEVFVGCGALNKWLIICVSLLMYKTEFFMVSLAYILYYKVGVTRWAVKTA